MDEMTLTLSSPITEEQFDAITDVDFDNTGRIWFHTKNGKDVEFVKRKKGKWIKRDVSRQIHGISCSAPNYQCSVCKKWWFHNGEGLKWYKFCPECGADMRGDDHDL